MIRKSWRGDIFWEEKKKKRKGILSNNLEVHLGEVFIASWDGYLKLNIES